MRILVNIDLKGPLAAEASARAVEMLHERRSMSPAVILDHLHEALSSTRGAAVSVLRHDARTGEVTHAGVGNIAVRLLGDTDNRTLPPQPGIVGHRMPRVRELTVPVGAARVAVLHRTGEVGVGEPSVIVAASAGHRPAAFSACRMVIEELKERVPIWKRDVTAAGPGGWQDGVVAVPRPAVSA